MVKLVNLEEPTSFLDHVYFGWLNLSANRTKVFLRNTKKMFESRISAWATEKLPGWDKSHANTIAWSCKETCGKILRIGGKKFEQLYKVSTPCLDDHQFNKEELETVGELSNVCSRIALKFLFLARIGRPDILWSENKVARADTKWTRALVTDLQLVRFPTFITRMTTDNIAMWVIQHSTVDWDCSKIQILLATLRTRNQLRGRILCIFRSRTFIRLTGYLLLTWRTRWQKCYVLRRVPNHQPMGQQETAREITNPNPNKRDTEMMIKLSHVIVTCGLRHHKRTFSSGWVSVVHLWR